MGQIQSSTLLHDGDVDGSLVLKRPDIDTGLGADDEGDTVNLYTPDTGADPDGGEDTIVFGEHRL